MLLHKLRLCWWVYCIAWLSPNKCLPEAESTQLAGAGPPFDWLSRWDACVLVQGKDNTKCASRMQVKF